MTKFTKLPKSQQVYYKNQIFGGIPVIQAFESERKSAPFGIYIHESARAFHSEEQQVLPYIWWKWYDGYRPLRGTRKEAVNKVRLASLLKKKLTAYFDWCEANHYEIDYAKDRISEYKSMMNQYFQFEIRRDNAQTEPSPQPSR